MIFCSGHIACVGDIFVKFSTKELRNEWLEAMQTLKEPPPVVSPDPPAFEPHVNFMPNNSVKRYPQPHMAIARAGPSAD